MADDDEMSEEQFDALLKELKNPNALPQLVKGHPCDHCRSAHGTIEHSRIVTIDGTVIDAALHEDCIDAYIDMIEERRKHLS